MINSKIKKIIKEFRKTPVDQNWLSRSQEQMIEFMKINPVRKTEVSRLIMPEGVFNNFKLLILKPMPIAIIALIISLATGGGVVAASQASLPTDALYPVKIATEQIREAMTFNNAEKIDLSVKLAEKRLDEIKQLQKRGEVSPAVIEETLIKYEKHLATAQSQLTNANSDYKTSNLIAAAVKYENSLEKQQEKLTTLTNQTSQTSAASRPSFDQAQKANIANSNQVLEKISIKIQETETGQTKASPGVTSDEGVTSYQTEVLPPVAMGKIPEYIPGIGEKTKNRINAAENKLAEIRKKIDNFAGQNENQCTLAEKQTHLEKLETYYQKIKTALTEAQKLFDQKNYLTALSQANYVMASAIDTDNLVGQWRSNCGDGRDTPIACAMPLCDGAEAYPTGEFNESGCPIYKCAPPTCKAPTCVGAYQTGKLDSNNCPIYNCRPQVCDVPICKNGTKPYNAGLTDKNSGCPIYQCPKNECKMIFSNCSCANKCAEIIEGQGLTDCARACSLDEINNYKPNCGYQNDLCQDLNIVQKPCPDVAINCGAGSIPTKNGINKNGCPIWTCQPISEQNIITCPVPAPLPPGWCENGKIYPGKTDANGCHGAPRCEANEIDGSEGSINSSGETKRIVEPNESNTSNSAQTSQSESSAFDSILKFLQIK